MPIGLPAGLEKIMIVKKFKNQIFLFKSDFIYFNQIF